MTKKAYLVTFMITTRVITEKEEDPNNNVEAWNDVVSSACENLYIQSPDYSDCVDTIDEDTEYPYGTYEDEED